MLRSDRIAACYVCKNGGFNWITEADGYLRPHGRADNYIGRPHRAGATWPSTGASRHVLAHTATASR